MSAKKNQKETTPVLDSGSTPGMTTERETASTLDCGSGGAQRPGMTAERDCGTMPAMTAEEETEKSGDAEQKPLGMTATETAHHDGNAKNEPAKEKLSNSALAARLRFLACNFRALRDRAVMRQELKDLLERC